MANAQTAQEELQQSVILSDEDAEYEEDDALEAMDIDTTPAAAIHEDVGDNEGNVEPKAPTDNNEDDAEGEIVDEQPQIYTHKLPENEPANVTEDQSINDLPEDDLENDANDGDASHADNRSERQSGSDHEQNLGSEDDAEGEDDDMLPVEQNGAVSGDDEEDEEDEAEGVGAVKIKPGETDEDDSESEDDASLASGASDGESAAEWEAEAENEDDEDEDSEAEPATLCMFCKKDEENDPGEEFEPFLACKGCGEHGKVLTLSCVDALGQLTDSSCIAHQQCARDVDALNTLSGQCYA